MTSFKQLGLSEEILKVLSEIGFESPTEIQQKAIPKILSGYQDLIGMAQTGTGKTAAFAIPLLERIDHNNPSTQALILAPTRELGKQIAEHLQVLGKYKEHINVLAVYGGVTITNHLKALKKPQHIIIATPGRLLDLIKRKAVKLQQLEYLVLDEADEMLNMGFKEDLDKILSYTPDEKMTWLFSATMPDYIKKIIKTYMENPFEVRVNQSNEVNSNIRHLYTTIKNKNKTEALTRFLDLHGDMRGLVFCRTRRDTQNLSEVLLGKKYRVDCLHGDLSQAQRDRVMDRFKRHDLTVLIATDVAARGIDVNDLTHVIHYSLPEDRAYYTHRSGRTARAGKKGVSLVFVSGRESFKIKRLEKQLDISFKKIDVPDVEQIASLRLKKWCTEILNKKSKGQIDPQLLENANVIFGNLSKEELTAKVLMYELENLNLNKGSDLNDSDASESYRHQQGRDGRSGRGRGRGRDRVRGKGKGNQSFRGKNNYSGRRKKSRKKHFTHK